MGIIKLNLTDTEQLTRTNQNSNNNSVASQLADNTSQLATKAKQTDLATAQAQISGFQNDTKNLQIGTLLPDGTVDPTNVTWRTMADFTPVNAGDIFFAYDGVYFVCMIAIYDINHVVISKLQYTTNQLFKIPANGKFMKSACAVANLADFMLTKGSTLIGYESGANQYQLFDKMPLSFKDQNYRYLKNRFGFGNNVLIVAKSGG